MNRFHSFTAVVCVGLLLTPSSFAQAPQQADDNPRTPRLEMGRRRWYSGVTEQIGRAHV